MKGGVTLVYESHRDDARINLAEDLGKRDLIDFGKGRYAAIELGPDGAYIGSQQSDDTPLAVDGSGSSLFAGKNGVVDG